MSVLFTQDEYDKFIRNLGSMAEAKYKNFNDSLIPGVKKSLGIRVPALRALAKEICAEDFRGFLACKMGEYHEERMLRAMIISGGKMPIDEKLAYIKEFLPYVDNWAVCDTLCNDFKEARKNREKVWDFTLPYFNSTAEFDLRFACVILLWHFTTEEYTVKSLDLIKNIHNDGYYAKMGAAWAVSEFFVHQQKLTLPYLESAAFEPWVQNKAIQKIRESYRVTDKDKEYLLNFKM